MECQVEFCPLDAESRGWCQKHYTRWRRHGDTSIVKRREIRRIEGVSDRDRLLSKMETVDGHWEWQGHLTNGYGRVWLSTGSHLAHRAVYEMFVGPIPDGLTLDHLCYNPRCVNPDHMETVTLAENVARAAKRRHQIASTCRAGKHPYPENRILERSTGKTRCQGCQREARARYKASRKAEAS